MFVFEADREIEAMVRGEVLNGLNEMAVVFVDVVVGIVVVISAG